LRLKGKEAISRKAVANVSDSSFNPPSFLSKLCS
jgi:hypothetical protein